MSKAIKALMRIGIFAFGLGFLSLALGESLSKEVDSETTPTNFGLLRLALEEAIEEMCDRLPLHEQKVLCLDPQADAPENWLVEHVLIQSLRRRGCIVVLSDTSEVQGHTACFGRQVLRYRVVDLDLLYPASRRKHLFGPRFVERQAHLHLFFRLDKDDGQVLWAGEAQRTKGDWIPIKMLDHVEQESVPFISPRLKADNWGRFAEPALLTTVVGGLIYLFYATQ